MRMRGSSGTHALDINKRQLYFLPTVYSLGFIKFVFEFSG